jgi:sigma-B regulation protein RsbU (phosphoserine phosphatase)
MDYSPSKSDKDVGLPGAESSDEDALFFDSFPVGAGFDIANATLPAKPPTSGDFHAAFPLEDGTLALVMGDVVGHGEAAAAHATTLCRAIGGCLIEGLEPSEALAFVNAAAEMSADFEGFATAFAGTVDPHTGMLTYANGGHEPGLIADPLTLSAGIGAGSAEAVRELNTTGPPLGVLGGDEVRYEQNTIGIASGGTLLLYTDGVTEARRGKELLGIGRLRTLLTRFLIFRPLRLVRKIIGYARAFTGEGRKLRDDAALLVLRRRH